MQAYPHQSKSFWLKIFRVSPYYSKILTLTSLQVHCFHRPKGEGVPRRASPQSEKSASMQTAGTI
jgi:hypothetical protein